MSQTQVSYEADNVTPPLKNTIAKTCIAVFIAGPSSQVADLSQYFANPDNSHYFTIQADGTKAYVAFSPGTGTIDETALGVSTLACWSIPDQTSLPVRPVFGSEVASGSATLTGYHFLIYKAATGAATGSSTGYVRIYRSSLSPAQDAGREFKGPVTGF